jgi:hypothetical protein
VGQTFLSVFCWPARMKRTRQARMPVPLIQIKIANRFTCWRVLGFLHRLFKFLGQDVFLMRFLKKRISELVFALPALLRQNPCAFSRSTFGPGFTGASCESTAPNTASTTSFAWQHGHVTCRLSGSFFPISAFYAKLPLRVTATRGNKSVRPKKQGHDSSCPCRQIVPYYLVSTPSPGSPRA